MTSPLEGTNKSSSQIHVSAKTCRPHVNCGFLRKTFHLFSWVGCNFIFYPRFYSVNLILYPMGSVNSQRWQKMISLVISFSVFMETCSCCFKERKKNRIMVSSFLISRGNCKYSKSWKMLKNSEFYEKTRTFFFHLSFHIHVFILFQRQK